ncbi:HK97 gp10 family phage protein [Massilia sp. X63]
MSELTEVVERTVREIRESVNEPALRKVGFAGAEVFRDEAKRNAMAHIQTGTIYRNIIVKRLEEQSDGGNRQAYLVTVRKGDYGGGDAFYWRFVEHGHKFVPRNTRVSARTGRKIGWAAHRRAAELEYGTASAPAYPFMRPAYESKKGAATSAMTRALSEILARNT